MATERMRVLMGAEPNGFGPVAKLAAIARLLPDTCNQFIGTGIALDFARLNRGGFDDVLPSEALESNPSLIQESDFGIVVMEPDLGFSIFSSGRPFYLFDSLFDFWVLPRGLAPVLAAAREIRRVGAAAGSQIYHSFNIHERKLMAHAFATRSFVQNYPGVAERVEEARSLGVDNIEIVGSMVDLIETSAASKAPAGDGWEMLVNLGGVQNFAISFNHNDHYIDLVESWTRRFLARESSCRKITLCCGRYRQPSEERIGQGVLRRELLPHDRFIAEVRRTDLYLSAPGRTAIHEAFQLRRLPLLLPEQHCNQLQNLQALRGTLIGDNALQLEKILEDYQVPEDDVLGTRMIIERTEEIASSSRLYERFDRELSQRVEWMRGLGEREREAALTELEPLMSGTDLSTVLRKVMAEMSERRGRGGD